jgi:hypothetical protein
MSTWRLFTADANEPPRLHPEDDLQRAVVEYLRWALPDDALAFHIPNGGLRHKRAAARLAGLGLRAGMPDLCVVWRGLVLFIELKAPRGVLSAVQRQMKKRLEYCGCPIWVCRTVSQVEIVLRDFGLPLRAECR